MVLMDLVITCWVDTCAKKAIPSRDSEV